VISHAGPDAGSKEFIPPVTAVRGGAEAVHDPTHCRRKVSQLKRVRIQNFTHKAMEKGGLRGVVGLRLAGIYTQ